MPRAADRFPDRRGGNDLHSPLRGLLDFTTPLAMTAQAAGDGIRKKIEDVVAFIKETTGIDLTGFTDLLNGLETATGLNLFELADLNLTDNIPQLLAALQGIDWSQPGAILQAIEDVAAAVPIIGPLLSALIGQAIPDDADPLGFAQTWGDNLRSILPGIDLNLPTAQFDPQTALANFVNDGLRPLRLLLGIGDPLPSQDLVGSILPHLLTFVPNTSVGLGSPNLVPDPSFQDGAALAAIDDDKITPDPTVGRTTAGSARIECDGNKHEILSDPATPVSPGQTIPFEAYARWQNLTTGASPVQLGAATYDAAGQYIGTTNIGAVGAAGTQLTFQKVSGPTYTVPEGVAYVRQSLAVMPTATSGFVWLDDADHHKTQLWPTSFTAGLPDALTGLWNGLGEAGDNLLDLIETLAGGAGGLAAIVSRFVNIDLTGFFDASKLGNIANIPPLNVDRVATLPDILTNTADDIASNAAKVLDTWNRIVSGYHRTTTTTASAADVEEVMISVGSEILVAQEATITLANQANAPRNVPFWVSPNRFEEVSFPRAMLQPVPTIGSGGGGATSTGSGLNGIDANWNAEERDAVQGHTHTAPSHSHVMGFAKPLYTIPAGTLALTAITMTQDRLINVGRFLAGGDTPPSTALYVGLYSIDPATGTQTLVYDYGDQKGNISTGTDLYETALNLPADMLADAGAMFALGILPVGGSFTVGAIRRQPISTAAVIYPKAATELVTGQTALPATVADASMSHTATHRIWVSLGQAVESVPEDNSPVTLSMTFDVADTSSWSSPSFTQSGTANSKFAVADGQIFGDAPTVLFGDNTYWRSALCLTSVHTNDHMAEITLGTGWDDAAYGYATDRAYVRCNSAGTSGVCLHVDATGGTVRVRIANIANMVSIGTVRATVTGLPYALGDRFRIEAVGNTYQAYRNDVAIPGAVWVDDGNVVPTGKAWRRHGFGSGVRCTNGFTRNVPAHIDRYRAADVAA